MTNEAHIADLENVAADLGEVIDGAVDLQRRVNLQLQSLRAADDRPGDEPKPISEAQIKWIRDAIANGVADGAKVKAWMADQYGVEDPSNLNDEQALRLTRAIQDGVFRDAPDGPPTVPAEPKMGIELAQRVRSTYDDRESVDRGLASRYAEEHFGSIHLNDWTTEQGEEFLLQLRMGSFDQEVDAPSDPPKPPPADGPGDIEPGVNRVRLYYDLPEDHSTHIRFASSQPFGHLESEPIAWGPDGSPTSYLNEGQVGAADVVEGYVDVARLWRSRGVDEKHEYRTWTLGVVDHKGEIETLELYEMFRQLQSIQVSAHARPWRPGIDEVEVFMQATADGVHRTVSVHPGSPDFDFYCPDVDEQNGVLVHDPHRGTFFWPRGLTTVRRFLIGEGITEEDKRRFERFEHFGTLTGPASYESGGWGPTRAALPRLDDMSVGWDLQQERHEDGTAQAANYTAHVAHPGAAAFSVPVSYAHPEFKNDSGLGPWHPRGDRGGGGTGGSEIHPYSAWAQTPGELRAAWWQMRTMMERMLANRNGGVDAVPVDVELPDYADELLKYRHHDVAHGARAMLAPLACAWGMGSAAARQWFRVLTVYYGEAKGYGKDFDGAGHKWAHRGLGWHAAVWATRYALTPFEDARRTSIRAACLDVAQVMHDVAMPTGITHRAASSKPEVGGGPFSAFLNPDLHALGELPAKTTVARTFMGCIVVHGAYCLEQAVLGDGSMRLLVVDATESLLFLGSTPPKGHVIVGGLEIDDVHEKTSDGPADFSTCTWEAVWALAEAYRMSGERRFLERAAEVMGFNPANLEAVGFKEYQRTGSARAWWERSVEVVAEIQRLGKKQAVTA